MLHTVSNVVSKDMPMTMGSVAAVGGVLITSYISYVISMLIGLLWIVLLITKIRKERAELRLLHTKEAAGTLMDITVGDDNA